MILELTDEVRMESDIPIRQVEWFRFFWKPCSHAVFRAEGVWDKAGGHGTEQYDESSLKVWQVKNNESRILFHGYIRSMELRYHGQSSRVMLEAVSASERLDRRIGNRSFQNTGRTYGEIVREVMERTGGSVISNPKQDKKIESPVFCCGETGWHFTNRMAKRIGSLVIPDIETGRPNLWFGMREGKEIPCFLKTDYHVEVSALGKGRRIRLGAEDRNFYQTGDYMTWMGRKMTIVEVEGRLEHGELTFSYVLEDQAGFRPDSHEEGHPAGRGFWGNVRKVKGEMVKLALDMDGGEETGDSYYPWYPETGNVLYATPEEGARAFLCFFEEGEREGAVIYTRNPKQKEERDYKERELHIKGGNKVCLGKRDVKFCRGRKHRLSLGDGSLTFDTSKRLRIMANGKIRMKARQIIIDTPDEVNICQG